jgi:tetratricopeptide (TPR) repeat protein
MPAKRFSGQSETGAVVEDLRAISGGDATLPTVLCVDDVHWASAGTAALISRIWTHATRGRWPLLIVLTHERRAWDLALPSQMRGSASETLRRLVESSRAAVHRIPAVPDEAMRAVLRARLPGLTERQRSLLVAKAAGNFRMMEENIGALIVSPQRFEGCDVASALTPEGEEWVLRWESERSARIEQLIGQIDRPVRRLLACCSGLGYRFPRDVVATLAAEFVGNSGEQEALLRSVESMAVLERAGNALCGFRDEDVRRVLDRERGKSDCVHRNPTRVLRRSLAVWVNSAFDGMTGCRIRSTAKGERTPRPCIEDLDSVERRALLELAMRRLPLAPIAEWSDPEQIAAFRAVVLAIEQDRIECAWPRLARHLRRLAKVDFAALPARVLASSELESLGDSCELVGADRMCENLLRSVLLRISDQDPSREFVRASLLGGLARVHDRRGDPTAGLASEREGLECLQRVLVQHGDDASGWLQEVRREAVVRMRAIAGHLACIGEVEAARQELEEAIAASRSLVDAGLYPRFVDELCCCLCALADMLVDSKESEMALGYASEAESTARKSIATWDGWVTTDLRRTLGRSLMIKAVILTSLGRTTEARAQYLESAENARRLVACDDQPAHLRDLCIATRELGMFSQKSGDFDMALASYAEFVAVGTRLSRFRDELGSWFDWRREVAAVLMQMASIYDSRDDDAAAIDCLQRYRSLVDSVYRAEGQGWALRGRIRSRALLAIYLSAAGRGPEGRALLTQVETDVGALCANGARSRRALEVCAKLYDLLARAHAAVGAIGLAEVCARSAAEAMRRARDLEQ